MKIGIVLHPYGERSPAGLARTIFEFTKGMLMQDRKNEYVIYLKHKPKIVPDLPGKNWHIAVLGGGAFWLDALRNREKADTYIFNTPVMPFLYKPQKSIVLVLDFAYFYLAGLGMKSKLHKWATFFVHKMALKRADKIIAISQATKNDIIKFFSIPAQKIDVIYLGYKKICSLPQIKVSLPGKFFFFAGIIKERKNVFNIVKAFHAFSRNNKDFYLVVGGSAGGSYFEKINAYVRQNKLNERVIFLGHLNDGQLSYVYRRAHAFVFPTLIEGFGMPVLEAMDCEIPVITSNQSSLKEVGGSGSSLLVDPYNVNEIANAMEKITINPSLKQELILRGKEQIKKFSWRKAAGALLEIIKKTGA